MKREALPQPMRPVLCIVGARPNFMKVAPILRAFAEHDPPVPALLVHTGQHYDRDMSERLFEDLQLPAPDINLEVGSGTHAVQTAEVMRRFEPVVDRYAPACVLVVGDVNSTLACALVATKKGVPVVHVEAGLRSFDRAMPEEINRVLTDQIADRLYTTESSAGENLRREGVAAERVRFVGNVMIDSLLSHRRSACPPSYSLRRAGADPAIVDDPRGFALATLHRPSNVDSKESLAALLGTLREVAAMVPVVFVLHPRTKANIARFDLGEPLSGARVALLPPQGYLEMLGLTAAATVVLTDSGGLQEETTALGVPCLTMRENTERPITVDQGTNILVGGDRDAILSAVREILAGAGKAGRAPELWDGQAARRIAADLWSWLGERLLADGASGAESPAMKQSC
jgi:UDP-N-acetylglucosamine 2-epimerase (non-hydrolysing)